MGDVAYLASLEEIVTAKWSTILSLWRAGRDTREISNQLRLPEYAIYNFFICKRVRR